MMAVRRDSATSAGQSLASVTKHEDHPPLDLSVWMDEEPGEMNQHSLYSMLWHSSTSCLHDEEAIRMEVEEMQLRFEEIQHSMLDTLEKDGIKIKRFRRSLSTYPGYVQLKAFTTLKKASGDMDLDDIFSIWNTELVWSFLDFTLLEHIVKRLGSDNLKEKMEQYSDLLKRFRERTTVFKLIKLWPNFKPPHDYEECRTAILTLKENARECTLEKLELLRKQTCRKLQGYKLSEAALVMFDVRPGSIKLIWILHKKMVPDFKKVFRECETTGTFFKENGITKLELDGEIFPKEQVAS